MESFNHFRHSPLFSTLRKSSPNSNSRFLTINSYDRTPPPRTPQSPSMSKGQMLTKELDRLEEELDFKLVKLNKSVLEEYDEAKQHKKQAKAFEKCIEGVTHCLRFIDVKIFKLLNKAWIGLQKNLSKDLPKTAKPGFSHICTSTQVLVKDFAVQVGFELDDNEDYDDYINLLNRAMGRIGGMNHDKLIKKLKKLLSCLTPIEIPDDPPESPTFLSNIGKFETPIPITLDKEGKIMISRNRLGYIQISRGEQTSSGHAGPSYETLLEMLKERDKEIYHLREEASKHAGLNKKIEGLETELMICRKMLKDEQDKECRNCLDRIEKAKRDRSQIDSMKQTLNKSGKLHEELNITKTKLNESILVIGKNNEKINVMAENLSGLQSAVEEADRQRKILESRLAEEENLRKLLEFKLKQESQKVSSLSNQYKSKLSFPSEDSASDNFLHKFPIKNSSLTRPSIKQPTIEDPSLINTSLPDSTFTSKTPTIERRTTKLQINESISSGKMRFSKSKNLNTRNLLTVLKMSKSEFLSLSKKVRLELFECLYEHKERCGAECEHLKRAMMIRKKEKGPILPLKKCNIVKQ